MTELVHDNEEVIRNVLNNIIKIQINTKSKSCANAIYNSLRVEKEPNNTVTKKLSVNGNILSIELMSLSISSLRASSNGLLDQIKLLLDVVDNFEISDEYSYDYFLEKETESA